jgi:site-specific DNA recombinase
MFVRYAFYGRLSTDDRQDVTLARPSQLKACSEKIEALGGVITAEYFDQESGSHADRRELLALIAEASDAETRRFDRVIVYSTSRLSRDRVDAALFERDLRRLDAPVSYVDGGGSQLEIAIKQAIDEHERNRLKIETRRGQAQNIRNGYRCGGRAPYGYQLQREPHPVAVRAAKGDTKSRLVPNVAEAATIVRIYRWWVEDGLGNLAIADRLNELGVPSPVHTNTKRNIRGTWAKTTIRAILQNPVYTGLLVWDRTDHSLKRERGGGGARRRDRDEWVLSEVKHPALVSEDLWNAAQARFASSPQRRGGRKGQKRYLLSGLCKCASGHQPLAMFGSATRDYVYMRCDYGRQYGRAAAAAIESHGQWCSVREDALMSLVLDFFEARVFGATRMDRLAEQIDAQPRADPGHEARARLEGQIADADSALAAQVRGLEAGVDAALVQARIDELKAERAPLAAALVALGPELPADNTSLAKNLDRLPDLNEALRRATPDIQRKVFEAFALRIEYDRTTSRARISATIDDALADALCGARELESARFCTDSHGGGRIRTFEGRANAFTARPL